MDCAGLNPWSGERAHISRRLHDEIGPALCAAAFHLAVIEQRLETPSAELEESIRGMRESLAAAAEEIRALSYLYDPAIVQRIGLEAAIGYVCRILGADPPPAHASPRRDQSAAAAFDGLRAAALGWRDSCPAARFRIALDADSIALEASEACPEAVLRALPNLVEWNDGGLRVVFRAPCMQETNQ